MKKSFVVDYSLCLIARSTSSLIRFIPIEFSVFIARTIGALAFNCFLRRKRNIAYKNVKIAFPQKSCSQINKIVKKAFMNSAQHFIELFYLPWLGVRYIKRFIEFEGLDKVLDLIRDRKGVIFLGLHEGSWEVASVVMAQTFKEYRYTVLARTQTDTPLLSELLNTYRIRHQCAVIRLKDNLRPLVEHLNKGFALGMVADHGAQGGIFVDFFGRPALTPTGGVRLALKLDTHLIVGFIRRKVGAYHKISLTCHNLIRTKDLEKDIKTNLEQINRKYEEYIKENPEEYLWFFKRWKYSPQKNILVLSDGKQGHLKQSLAVLELIESLPFKIKADILEIKFKNRLMKMAFLICGLFFSNKCQGCTGCLSRLYGYNESRKLLSNYYDVVISCGSSLSMVNRLIAFENMAKSIVIMKPGMFSLKRFDLVIMPEHENVVRFSNVVSIKGALSRNIDKNNENIRNIITDYGLDSDSISHPVIGLVLGGDNKYLSLDTEIVKEIVVSLKKCLDKIGGTLLVSTSRRTPTDIAQFLKVEFKDYPRCKMLIIANEFNPKGSFEALLYCSDILVVSGDSVSMISEALNCAKYTLVFKLKRKRSNFLSKHERFIDSLKSDNYIQIVYGQDLFDKITDICKNRPAIKRLDNREIILERLKKIL